MEGVEHGMGAWLVRGPAGDPSLTPNIQATDACLFAADPPDVLVLVRLKQWYFLEDTCESMQTKYKHLWGTLPIHERRNLRRLSKK